MSIWEAILALVKSVNGGILGAIVVASVQLLIVLFRDKFGDLAGKWKLAVVAGLTGAFYIAQAIAAGKSLVEALLDAGSVAAYQVLASEIIKALKEPSQAAMIKSV